MSAEAPQHPARLLVATAAGPHEVAAAASVAAAHARGIFSSDVREDTSGPDGIDYLVTSPLARRPSLRLCLGWSSGPDGLDLVLDVETLDEPSSPARAERAHRAVEAFAARLQHLLAS